MLCSCSLLGSLEAGGSGTSPPAAAVAVAAVAATAPSQGHSCTQLCINCVWLYALNMVGMGATFSPL